MLCYNFCMTQKDLEQIRLVIREEVESTFESKGRVMIREEVEPLLDRKLEPILDKLEALENDVKEIYTMLREADIPPLDESLSPEKKIIKMHKELLNLAKELNISLVG